MGMFDKVKIEFKLPEELGEHDGEFQTKDFECIMDTYRIAEDGKLYVKHYEYEVEPGFSSFVVTNKDEPDAFFHYTGEMYALGGRDDLPFLDLEIWFKEGVIQRIKDLDSDQDWYYNGADETTYASTPEEVLAEKNAKIEYLVARIADLECQVAQLTYDRKKDKEIEILTLALESAADDSGINPAYYLELAEERLNND